MNCNQCGNEREGNKPFCSSCGASFPAENGGAEQGYYGANPYGGEPQNSGYNYNPYGQGQYYPPNYQANYQPYPPPFNPYAAAQIEEHKNTATSAMVFGILGLVFSSIVLGLIFGILALVKSKQCLEPLRAAGAPTGAATAGRIMGIISVIFASLILFYYFFLVFIVLAFI